MYGNCVSGLEAYDTFLRVEPRHVVSWTAMITVFSRQDRSADALSLFYQMQSQGIEPTKVTFASLLAACASNEASTDGRNAHAYIVELGFECDTVLSNALISMYNKCASVSDARIVFDHVKCRDVVTWTAMIGAYTQHLLYKDALQVFYSMQLANVIPNVVTLVNLLSACACAAATTEGMTVHLFVIERAFEQNNVVANALMVLYGNGGSTEDAMCTFNGIAYPIASNWTTIIAVSAQHGQNCRSWHLFDLMQEKGMQVNKVTFITILKACTCAEALVKGEAFHTSIINCGYESDITVGNALIGMYSRCTSLHHAEATFLQMLSHDIVTLTSMIVAYIQCGFCNEGSELFELMIGKGIIPDKVSFISLLSACMKFEALELGHNLHAKVIEIMDDLDTVLSNALLTMYGRCGSIESAVNVFKLTEEKNIISWNTLISFHAQNGDVDEALRLFQQMYIDGVKTDVVSFVSVLSTCTGESKLGVGRLIHALLVDKALESESILGNTLVSMYGKCGSVTDAKWVFESVSKIDIVAWTSMLAAYAQHGDSSTVVNLYYQMQSKAVKPDKFIYSLVVAACNTPEMLHDGESVHACIMQSNIEVDIVLANALINMYGKCGSAVSARQVFNNMSERDLFSFNAMIAVHAQFFQGNEAFQTFQQMQLEGIEADKISYLGLLSACSTLTDLNVGKMIHTLVSNGEFKHDDAVVNAFINIYSKCGSVECAWITFESLPERGIAAWTSMITALADHGNTGRAFELFELMVEEGIEPNDLSFVSVLSACSRAGLMDQALEFLQMTNRADMPALPSSHFRCTVDLAGRLGRLEEAEIFLSVSPYQPSIVDWMTLLSASKTFYDVQRGRRAAYYLMELDEEFTATYVVLGNAFAGSDASC
ncbi:hypothetical protein L7F22_065926 [Adiantum nelumboides]|nr:hypothetical protein [Adiantum nelumboides]